MKITIMFLIILNILKADINKIETFLTEGTTETVSQILSINEENLTKRNIFLKDKYIVLLGEDCIFDNNNSKPNIDCNESNIPLLNSIKITKNLKKI